MAGGPKNHDDRIFRTSKKRGAIEGPIRIPLDSLLFLFNGLALPSIPSKSLKFQSPLLSTSTRLRQTALTARILSPTELSVVWQIWRPCHIVSTRRHSSCADTGATVRVRRRIRFGFLCRTPRQKVGKGIVQLTCTPLSAPTVGCEVGKEHRHGAIGVYCYMLEKMLFKVGR